MKNADMPAMPQSATGDGYACNYYDYDGSGVPTGLTKREMMAMHIASGFAADGDVRPSSIPKLTIEVVDALLRELETTAK